LYPRILIPDSSISSSFTGPISIEQIEIGEVEVPKINMNNFFGEFSYSSAKAKDVEIEIRMSINTEFDGRIDLPWPFSGKDVDGHVNFPTRTETYKLDDIDVAAGSFKMESANANSGPFKAKIDPIGNNNNQTSVSKTSVNCIGMKCTEMKKLALLLFLVMT